MMLEFKFIQQAHEDVEERGGTPATSGWGFDCSSTESNYRERRESIASLYLPLQILTSRLEGYSGWWDWKLLKDQDQPEMFSMLSAYYVCTWNLIERSPDNQFLPFFHLPWKEKIGNMVKIVQDA